MKYIMYRISAGDYTYIGSTKDFKQRKNAHKYACETKQLKVYQMIRQAGGWDNCEMVPIEEFECETTLESRIREEQWRREYNANMNSVRAHRTEEERIEQHREGNKEWNKKHYEENKEIVDAKHREYYHANIEKERERSKARHDANKEKEQSKRTCECGGKYTYMHKSTHENTKKHIKYLEEQKSQSIITTNGTC